MSCVEALRSDCCPTELALIPIGPASIDTHETQTTASIKVTKVHSVVGGATTTTEATAERTGRSIYGTYATYTSGEPTPATWGSETLDEGTDFAINQMGLSEARGAWDDMDCLPELDTGWEWAGGYKKTSAEYCDIAALAIKYDDGEVAEALSVLVKYTVNKAACPGGGGT